MLKEKDIIAIRDRLDPRSLDRVDNYVSLQSGRGGQHLSTDIEISEMIREINKQDLL